MPTATALQRLIWSVIATGLSALPWILAGLGAIAFLSHGPIGRAPKRLARAKSRRTGEGSALASR